VYYTGLAFEMNNNERNTCHRGKSSQLLFRLPKKSLFIVVSIRRIVSRVDSTGVVFFGFLATFG
jgi:hypothetical protein